jgi:hypothetical protein
MAVFFLFKMIIKGYIHNIQCYTGQVYIGSEIEFMRRGLGIVAKVNDKFIGELDPISKALLELYLPFLKEIRAIATNLHNGEVYPVQINLDFNYVAFKFR